MLPGGTPARLWARRHSAASASVRAGRAANDVMVIVAGIAGGGLFRAGRRSSALRRRKRRGVVADDEVERGGWLGWFGRGHEFSPVSRCDKDIITYRNRAARFARRFYLAGSAAGVSGAGGEWNSPRLSPRGCSRITEHGGDGSGFHPAMVRTCARAFALSVIPGNRRRSSIAADSSPSWLKMARIASASASVTRNIPRA